MALKFYAAPSHHSTTALEIKKQISAVHVYTPYNETCFYKRPLGVIGWCDGAGKLQVSGRPTNLD